MLLGADRGRAQNEIFLRLIFQIITIARRSQIIAGRL